MIFNTWLTDLTKIQGVLNNIESIEPRENDETRLLNLSSAINGLNLQQARLALSTKELTQDQMNEVLVEAGLIASENKIKGELLQSALAQAGLSAEKQKAILLDLGLMNATTNEILATQACTKEELLNMLATKGVTGAKAEEIISILRLTGANGAATISFKLLTASIWDNIKALITWLATNPATWIIAGAAATYLVIKAIEHFNDSLADVEKRIETNQRMLSEYTSKTEELTAKLEELNDIDVSYFSDNEKQKLETEKKYLQSEIDLYNQLIEAKQKAINQDVIKAVMGKNETVAIKKLWSEITSGDWEGVDNVQKELASKTDVFDFIIPNGRLFKNVDDGNYFSEAEKLFEEYRQLQDKYAGLEKLAIYSNNERLAGKIDETSSKKNQVKADIAAYIEKIAEARNTLINSSNSDDYAEEITEMTDAIEKYQGVLNGAIYESKYAGYTDLQRDLLSVRDAFNAIVGSEGLENFDIFDSVTKSINRLINIIGMLNTYSLPEILQLSKIPLTEALNNLNTIFENLETKFLNSEIFNAVNDKLSDTVPAELIERWENLKIIVEEVVVKLEEFISYISDETGITDLLDTLRVKILNMLSPFLVFIDNYRELLGKAKSAWDEAHSFEYSEHSQDDSKTSEKNQNLIYLFSFTGFTEEQSKSIDNFQSKMKTLGDTLSSLRSGEDIGFADLEQEFPELAGQSENLEDAIKLLIYDSLNELYDVLGEGLPTEVKDDLQSIADTASGITPALDEAFSAIQKSYDVMQEFKSAMNGDGLTESILSNVGSLSNTLNTMVAAFHSGHATAEQLYAALTEHYNTDLTNYGNALIAKNLMSEEFYNAVGLTDTDLIKSFSDNYGVDIENCKNYNQAKIAIEEQTLHKLGDRWKKYYNIQADAYTDDLAELGGRAAHGDQEAQKQIVELMKYRKAIEALDKITYDEIEENFKKIKNDFGKKEGQSGDSSVKEETEEIFDFIAIKIENLEKQISRLEETASDTGKSLKKRQQAYTDAISATTSEIELQQQAYQKYMEKANSFDLSEEWAVKVRDGSLDIDSVTNDTLKEQIKSYQEWYKKAMECSDSVDELKKKLKELETAKIQLEIDVKSDKLDKLESAYDRIENKISISELFGGKASSGKYDALNKNLQKQIQNLYEQNDLIGKQAALVKKGSEAWNEYQKSIEDNNASIRKLMQTIAENAKKQAELTNEKASEKIDGYDAEDDYYKAKSANQTGYRRQNAYLDKEIGSIQKRRKAYASADAENEKSLKAASSAVGKIKKNSFNKDILKEAEKYTKSRKEIPSSLLEKAAALNDGGTLYKAFVNYNAALAAYATGRKTRKLYEETSKADEAALIKQKADNIKNYYNNKQSRYSQRASEINSAMDMAEAQGYTISTKYYYQLINVEKKNNASLKEEREKLIASLAEAVENGSIAKYSAEWYEMQQAIDDVTNAIDKSNLSLKEYENTIRQIKWDRFDELEAKIGNLASEMDFMIKELSWEDLFSEDDGWLTENGKAVSSLHASKYTIYTQQIKDYKKELQKINKELAEDPYNQDLIKRKEDLYNAYQQTVSAAQDEKDAIIDLYQNGYDALLSRVGDLISEYEKLMDAEKSAYDYQQKIADATKNISSLRKQLDAYAGDTSEETRAKIQSLTVELAEAEKDLKDTQYDKMISATKDMLSDLQEDMNDAVQDIIDSLSDNFEELLKRINGDTDRNIIDFITGKMDGIGYMPTEELNRILKSFYGSFYQNMFGNEDGGLENFNEWTDMIRTTKETIESIRDYWKQAAEEANKNAYGGTVSLQHEAKLIIPLSEFISLSDVNSHLFTTDILPTGIPDIESASKNISVNIGDIVLPDVTDPKQFANALKDVVINNSSVQNMLRETTIGTLSKNSNSMTIRKY